MSPEEIISPFIENYKKILYFGKNQNSFKTLPSVEIDSVSSISEIETLSIDIQYDCVIVTNLIEAIESPFDVFIKLKPLSRDLVIFENKYDHIDEIDPFWKQHWKTNSLEWFLNQHYNYINNIFLGYATVHICKEPYDREKESIDAN